MKFPSFTVQIFLGIATGIFLGLGLKHCTVQPWNERQLMYLLFPGELFLRVVNCLLLPLIITSIISATCNLEKSKNIGIIALFYYVTTTTIGMVLCVLLALIVGPGERGGSLSIVKNETRIKFVTIDTLLDLGRNLFPENIIHACLYQYQTILTEEPIQVSKSIYDMKISHRYNFGTNVLGLVFFSLIFGLALGTIPKEKSQSLKNFFQSLSDVVIVLIDRVIKTVPLAMIFLISTKILRNNRENEMNLELLRLGIYVLTVLGGLTIHACFNLPLLYFLVCKSSPYRLLKKIGPALVTAFGTSSSTATVPTTIRCLDESNVDVQVSRFVVPIGATINMDGIALYETMGALFIMQMRGFRLDVVQTVVVSITCTLSCIGAAGMPSGGYPMLIVVLNSLGVPIEDVALIIAVDSFVDRFRTMVNIVADCLGAGLISKILKKRRSYRIVSNVKN